MPTTTKKEKLESRSPTPILLPDMSKAPCDSIEGILASAGVTSEEVLKTLPKTREEVFAELYPKLAKRIAK